MKVLVTGADGFIGKGLCKELERQGNEVRRFKGDIRGFEDCKKNIKGAQAIYHLAAVLEESKKKEMKEVNVKGTQNLIEAALKESVEQFVFVSTVGVMGNFSGTGNEQTPTKPITDYEKSKAEAEKIVWNSQEMLPITIIRPAIVLGANNYWKQIVHLVEKNYPIIGNGKNCFQTVFIKDLVDALAFVLGREDCIGEIFIVAEEKPKTLEEIYSLIQKELGKKGKIKKTPKILGLLGAHFFAAKAKVSGKKTILLPEHVERLTKNRKYSIEKIKKVGWKPKYSTEQAIKETVKEILEEKDVQ